MLWLSWPTQNWYTCTCYLCKCVFFSHWSNFTCFVFVFRYLDPCKNTDCLRVWPRRFITIFVLKTQFLTLTVIFSLLLFFSLQLNIVTCGIVGAYVLLMAAAIPLHSTLTHIFLNAFYRQTVSGFLDVMIATPLNTEGKLVSLVISPYTI